jgi:hypothetical protein
MMNVKTINIILFLLALNLTGCNRCPLEIEISADLDFRDVAEQLRDFSIENEIVFVDEFQNEFPFVLEEDFSGLEKHRPGYMATCDNGDDFLPYYFRETVRKTYKGEDGSVIKLTLFASTSGLARSEDDQLNHYRDIFAVSLDLPGCDPYYDEATLTNEEGVSRLILDFPVTISKHGHSYRDNIFVISRGGFSGDLKFVMGKGLVAFNYCGRDWIQRAD